MEFPVGNMRKEKSNIINNHTRVVVCSYLRWLVVLFLEVNCLVWKWSYQAITLSNRHRSGCMEYVLVIIVPFHLARLMRVCVCVWRAARQPFRTKTQYKRRCCSITVFHPFLCRLLAWRTFFFFYSFFSVFFFFSGLIFPSHFGWCNHSGCYCRCVYVVNAMPGNDERSACLLC